MVLVQNWPFFHLFFQALQTRKKCFTIFQNKKTPFQARKTASSKSGKISIFPEGLTHGFGAKLAIFQFFFLLIIGQENVFYDSLERKSAFLGYKNSMFKKWKNCDFCKGVNPWFWSKIGHFSIFLFLSVIGQEKVFYDILERKNAFLGYKNSKFKKWKNFDFSRGVNPWFWSEIGHFSIFGFQAIQARKKFFTIFQNEKMPFQIIKTTSLKS